MDLNLNGQVDVATGEVSFCLGDPCADSAHMQRLLLNFSLLTPNVRVELTSDDALRIQLDIVKVLESYKEFVKLTTKQVSLLKIVFK